MGWIRYYHFFSCRVKAFKQDVKIDTIGCKFMILLTEGPDA